jgi:hypothetical protein
MRDDGKYVIYDRATTRIRGRVEGYKTHAAAQAQVTRWGRGRIEDADHPKFNYGIAEINHYRSMIERRVRRTNLMSGKDFEESVNTPPYLSPASESYWSM